MEDNLQGMVAPVMQAVVLAGSLLGAPTALAADSTGTRVLVLFNSINGGTLEMARAVASGVVTVPGVSAVIKQIPRIAPDPKADAISIGYPVAAPDELSGYDGIAIGSPVHFGNMSADMRHFLDQTGALWIAHKLEGKPATVFMSAGSGGGSEVAISSVWNTLASHGMVIVPVGIRAAGNLDAAVPGGNSPLGAVSITAMPGPRPSANERLTASLQGAALARVALALRATSESSAVDVSTALSAPVSHAHRAARDIDLPDVPAPVGSYQPYRIADKLVFISQIALVSGKIVHPGLIGREVSEADAKEATRRTMMNVLAVLKKAAGGSLDNVKSVVQLTGYFATVPGYTSHAGLMDEASSMATHVFGDHGRHARASIGAVSLPLASPVEIQAVFELE